MPHRPTGDVVWCDAAFEERFGYTVADACAGGLALLVPSADPTSTSARKPQHVTCHGRNQQPTPTTLTIHPLTPASAHTVGDVTELFPLFFSKLV
jgi:PAS domain-containing protein